MTAPAVDTIVRPLTTVEAQDRKLTAKGKARAVKVGASVEVYGLAGRWAVWSEGPQLGTWWLQPRDGDAIDVYRAVAEKPSRGAPVVISAMQGCASVATTDLVLGGIRYE